MTDTLFRQEAIDARRHRLVGTVVAVVPPGSRLYTAVLGAVAAVMLLFVCFGTYASSASVRGIVAYDKGVARVFAPAAGEVRQIGVKVGSQVAAGDPLVAMSMAQGRHGLAAQIGELDRQIGEIDRQLQIAEAAGRGSASALEQQKQGLAETITSLERQLVLARGQIELADSALARNIRLAKQGAGSQHQVEETRRDLLTRRADSEALEERLATTRNSVAGVMLQLSQQRLDAEKVRSQLLSQRAVLAAQREDLQRADHLVISAPIDGEVTDVAAEVGQRATPDQSLVTIIPHGGRMEVRLFAPSSAIGFVHPGERVRLRFDAFPYRKYGWGSGRVTAVSRVAVDPATIDAAVRPTEPVFRVVVSIDSLKGMAVPRATIRPGMTLAADLVLQRRPLWALVVGPVKGAVGP